MSGPNTPGHVAIWATPSTTKDGGTASAGLVNSLGLYGNGGTPFGIVNSATPAPFSGSYTILGAGVSQTAAYLQVNGSQGLPFQIQIDGITGLQVSHAGVTLPTPLAPASGGTGLSSIPANGQLLIGNGTGYTLGTLTGGPGVSITNGAGFVTIGFNGTGTGTVTSVQLATGSTGLTVNGGTTATITTSGAFNLAGTLAAGYGGTGVSNASLTPITATGSTTARTLGARAADITNVKDFGAVGNGVTDDTAAIQAAINAAPADSIVFFPPGQYNISAQIVINKSQLHLLGAGIGSTSIGQNANNAAIFNVTGDYNQIDGFSLIYGANAISGATAIIASGANSQYRNIFIANPYIGIEFTGNSGQFINQFQIINYVSVGVYAHAVNDVFISQFILNAGNSTNGALGGIRLQDACEAFVATDGDILLGVYSLTTDATVYSIGTRPAYNRFTNVYFDSDSNTSYINNMVETVFDNCWFSGGRTGSMSPGLTLVQSDSLTFNNTQFFNNGYTGVSVSANAVRTKFIGCIFESNSVTAGVGVTHGAFLSQNNQYTSFIGCTFHNGLYTGQEGYGLFIDVNCSNYQVIGCTFSNLVSGAISDNGSAPKQIDKNLGYVSCNSGTGTVFVGQSIVSITHGLAATPLVQDIAVTISSYPVASGVATLWVTAITSTTFQIATNTVVTGTNLSVGWSAKIPAAAS